MTRVRILDELTQRTEEEYKGWSAVLLPENSGMEVVVYNPTPRFAGQISIMGFSIKEAIAAFREAVDQTISEESEEFAYPSSIGQKVRLLAAKTEDRVFRKWGTHWLTIESLSPLVVRRDQNSSDARTFDFDQLTDHDFACDCEACWPVYKAKDSDSPTSKVGESEPQTQDEVQSDHPVREFDSPTSEVGESEPRFRPGSGNSLLRHAGVQGARRSR